MKIMKSCILVENTDASSEEKVPPSGYDARQDTCKGTAGRPKYIS